MDGDCRVMGVGNPSLLHPGATLYIWARLCFRFPICGLLRSMTPASVSQSRHVCLFVAGFAKLAKRINVLFDAGTFVKTRNVVIDGSLREKFDAAFAKLHWPLVFQMKTCSHMACYHTSSDKLSVLGHPGGVTGY